MDGWMDGWMDVIMKVEDGRIRGWIGGNWIKKSRAQRLYA
jgi:hypothetical protein